MKTLATLISEYKSQPMDGLKQEIIDFIFNEENLHLFEDIFVYRNYTEWVDYGNGLKLKRLNHGKYLATEVFNSGIGYMCYCYTIDLTAYSPNSLDAYRNNCPDYKHSSPDDEFFTAAAVASAFAVENADSMCIVSNLLEVDAWFAKIEKEFA